MYTLMRQPLLLYYLKFICNTLEIYNVHISTVQSVAPKLSQSGDIMSCMLKKLLSMYMDNNYVQITHIDLINPKALDHNLPINALNIGPVKDGVKSDPLLTPQQKLEFCVACKNYLRSACDDLKKRVFETNNDWSIDKSAFHPKNVLSEEFHEQYPNLDKIMDEFKSFIKNGDEREVIIREWAEIIEYDVTEQFEIIEEKDIDVFWIKIRGIVKNEKTALFENLANLAMLCCLIPNSNASAERLWSKMNLEKTRLRNRLALSTLKAILLAAHLVKDQGGCLKFSPTAAMIEQVRNRGNCSSQDGKKQREDVEFVAVDGETEQDDDEELQGSGNVEINDKFDLIRACHVEDRLYSSWRFKKKCPGPQPMSPKTRKKSCLNNETPRSAAQPVEEAQASISNDGAPRIAVNSVREAQASVTESTEKEHQIGSNVNITYKILTVHVNK